jgi:hypothetical protein
MFSRVVNFNGIYCGAGGLGVNRKNNRVQNDLQVAPTELGFILEVLL